MMAGAPTIGHKAATACGRRAGAVFTGVIEENACVEVNIDKLRAVANALLSHVESHRGNAVTLSEDYYWDVPAAVRYDPYEKPKEHTLGQLSDDMAELTRMINGERPIIGYGLVWLAAILRRLGEAVEC